jgi:methylthioxylose transferase
MRRTPLIVIATQSIIVLAFSAALLGKRFPLGVAGEWEWPRIVVSPSAIDVCLAAAGASAYAAFAGLGWRALVRVSGAAPQRQALWLAGLVVAGVAAQAAIQSGAPLGYGLTKWVAIGLPGSSGYYTVAKTKMDDSKRFWADYPQWVKSQDSLHVGTHPPGLFLASRAMLDVMRASPTFARAVDDHLPGAVESGFREILGPLPRADRAALALIGALTMLACAATCVPVYLLGRASGLEAPAAWAAAALWPLVPAAILFQPTADTAFPLLSASALALVARQRPAASCAAGVVLGLGMQFSLVFLPIGLIAALTSPIARGSARRRIALIAWIGLGFFAVTLGVWIVSSANPFAIWWSNQRNHGRFYLEYPRSYLAWVVANPIELAIALGLPATIWMAIGARRAPIAAWATMGVLVLLTVSGKNLSEVARLWLPLMPPLLLPAGRAIHRMGGGGIGLSLTLLLMAAETLVLQCAIQVVYPA